MKIEVWLDFTCPFCYIAKKRFERAVEQFEFREVVDVSYKSYLLNPLVTKTLSMDANQALALHKDISVEEAKEIHHKIALMAFEDEISINFDQVQVTSTFHAHQLLKLISNKNEQKILSNAIYKAYFEEGKDISSIPLLIELGKQVGLSSDLIKKTLTSNLKQTEIEFDNDEAISYGITGVPFFVIDQTYSLSGAQKTEAFLEMLYRVYKRTVDDRRIRLSKTEYCVGDDCDYVPKIKKD
jgi:predicted DsbA family dithiol-disulfide isomerase